MLRTEVSPAPSEVDRVNGAKESKLYLVRVLVSRTEEFQKCMGKMASVGKIINKVIL